MAAVVKAFPSTGLRVDGAQAEGGKWTDLGGGKAATEDNFFYHNAACVSEKVSKATGGVSFDDSVGTANTEDVSTTPKTYVFKIYCYTVGLLNNKGATGVNLEIGSGGRRSAFYQYYVQGLDTWPLTRSWLMIPVDPNLAAYRDEITGSPSLTAVDYCGLEAATSGPAVKAENVALDAIDYVENGVANLLVTRGDSTDADATFQDFLDFDEGTATNRYGLVISQEGVIFAIGTLGIGEAATATEFTDSNVTIIWQDGLYDTGFAGILVDLGGTGTVVSMTDVQYIGRGREEIIRWFDTALDVDGTNEEVDITAHGFETGDYVTYTDEGGADSIGLTDTNSYWVNAVTADAISFHSTRANALAASSPVGLTAATAPGENHKLVKSIDTRPTITTTGTTGTQTRTGHTFNNIDSIVLTSGDTLTNCKVLNSSSITVSGATITGLTTSLPKLDEGAYLIDTADLDDLSGCDFTAGDEGHAIRMTSATSEGWDHTHSGYWNPTNLGWNFSTAQAFTSEQLNTDAAHGFATGDAVYYNDEGGVASIGLTDGNKYYVNVVDTDTVTVHVTKSAAVAGSSAINLTTSGSETHSLYSSKATVFNDTSSGTLTIGVTGGNAPSVRNAVGATTVVNVSVPVTFEAVDKDDAAIQSVRVTAYLISDDTEVINTTTNASGLATTTFSGSTPADIYYRYRKSSTGATKYVNLSGFGTIEADTGVTVKRSMQEDSTADPSI